MFEKWSNQFSSLFMAEKSMYSSNADKNTHKKEKTFFSLFYKFTDLCMILMLIVPGDKGKVSRIAHRDNVLHYIKLNTK